MQYKIAQGIIIPLEGRYIKFTKSNVNEVLVSSVGTEVKFVEGETSSTYSALVPEVELLNPYILFQETDWYKLSTATYKIGCIEISKNTEYDYIFSQFICRGIDKFMMKYSDTQCTILIPESKIKLSTQSDYDSYINIVNSNPYITLEGVTVSSNYILSNFYSINLSSFSIVKTSTNDFVFTPESNYDKFRLRTIDIQESFITQLKSILNANSIQLIKKVRDTRLNTTNQISYDITTVDKQINPRNLSNTFNPNIATQLYEMEFSFEASFTDYILMENFRRDYENYTYLSNFTTFDTADKYGVKWKSSIWWEPINTDTTLEFNTDSDGTYSFPLSFNCRIRYYNVLDPNINNIKLISGIVNADLNTINKDGSLVVSEPLKDLDIVVPGDKIIVTPITYYNISSESRNSTITGVGLYGVGTTAKLECIPNSGYKFLCWSTSHGEVTDNPYEFVVTKSELIIPVLERM